MSYAAIAVRTNARTSGFGPVRGQASTTGLGVDLLTAQTEPDGGRYELEYDASLRLTRAINPLGLSWAYIYDAAGRLVAETDFDEQGRTTSGTRPAGCRGG
ncbi:hypothetical protein SVIOM342S_00077 [Streptomyces violaceorubidus]